MIEVKKEFITKERVDDWYSRWEQLNEQIFAAHDKRDGSAAPLMEQGIELFEAFIIECSNTNEPFNSQVEYEIMPVNGMERFTFVKTRPSQYACYRQLDELYKETKKRCARLRLKK